MIVIVDCQKYFVTLRSQSYILYRERQREAERGRERRKHMGTIQPGHRSAQIQFPIFYVKMTNIHYPPFSFILIK